MQGYVNSSSLNCRQQKNWEVPQISPFGKLIQLIDSMLKSHNIDKGTCWFCSPGRIPSLPHTSVPTSCFSFYKIEIICLCTQGKFTPPKIAMRYELIYVKYTSQSCSYSQPSTQVLLEMLNCDLLLEKVLCIYVSYFFLRVY